MACILFVIDVMRPGGGAQKILKEVLYSLHGHGHKVKLLVLKRTAYMLDMQAINVECILNDEKERLLVHTFEITQKIYEESKQYDIIVSFMDFIVCYFVTLACMLAHKPYYAFVRCEPSFVAKTFANAEVNHNIYALCLQGASKVVCNSQSSCNDVVKNFGVSLDKVHLLYNPINLQYVAQRAEEKSSMPLKKKGEIFCICIGRLNAQKNYSTILHAFKDMKSHIKLFILGDGELKVQMQDFVREHGMENVYMLGYKDNIYPYVRDADIFIHCSFSEGFSNALLEAASLGLPLVLSNIAVHAEVFEQGALFFEPNDAYGLQRQVQLLAESEKMRKELSSKVLKAVALYAQRDFKAELLSIFACC